jgi:hypothetical protein
VQHEMGGTGKGHHAAAPSQLTFPAWPVHSRTGIPTQRPGVRPIRTWRERCFSFKSMAPARGKTVSVGKCMRWNGVTTVGECRGDLGAWDENGRGASKHKMRHGLKLRKCEDFTIGNMFDRARHSLSVEGCGGQTWDSL